MLLEMRDISKVFGTARVLDGVQFDLKPGEVHVLAGENGAGKSTLMKILCGVHKPTTGTMHVQGRPVQFHTTAEAAHAGITVIYQELSLVGPLSIAENLFLGREHTTAGWVRHGSQRDAARKALARLGLQLDVNCPVEQFSIPVRQMIEIAKALAFDARIIIMDEPTSALPEPDVERLFALIRDLRSRGCGIVYISHKMQEIYQLADRITVLRDGKYVTTAAASEMGADELVRQMVGRDLAQQFGSPGRTPPETGTAPFLRVKNLSLPDPGRPGRFLLQDVSFEVNRGEIVGISGLQGSGNSELLNSLFGTYGRNATGTVELEGKPYTITSPANGLRAGLALLTNDRKETGSVLTLPIRSNLTLPSLHKFARFGWLRRRHEKEIAREYVRSMRVRCAGIEQEIGELSGGNQQKVLLAKWLETRPRLLLLDEPTRGVDIGAKHDIYELIRDLRDQGTTILMVTTELPELLALSDRILVMHRGHITAEYNATEATQEKILHAAMGEVRTEGQV